MQDIQQPGNTGRAAPHGAAPAGLAGEADALPEVLLRLHAWASGTGSPAQCCEVLREGLDRPWVALAWLANGALEGSIVAWASERPTPAPGGSELATALRRSLAEAGDGILAAGRALPGRHFAHALPPHVLGPVSVGPEGTCVLLLGAREHDGDHERLLATGHALMPHAALAMANRQAVVQARLDARLMDEILDGTPAGFVIMDGAGAVLSLNADAREILQAADGLRLDGDRIASSQRAFDAALEDVLGALREAPGDAPPRTRGLLVRRPSGKAPYVLSFRTVGAPAADLLCARRDRLLLRIMDPVPERLPCLDFLMDTFALTRAEARVCQQTATGSRIGDAAAALCLSSTTVKSHLRRVYMKLGVSSRTGLLLVLQGALRATARPPAR